MFVNPGTMMMNDGSLSLTCIVCCKWFHRTCIKLSMAEFNFYLLMLLTRYYLFIPILMFVVENANMVGNTFRSMVLIALSLPMLFMVMVLWHAH